MLSIKSREYRMSIHRLCCDRYIPFPPLQGCTLPCDHRRGGLRGYSYWMHFIIVCILRTLDLPRKVNDRIFQIILMITLLYLWHITFAHLWNFIKAIVFKNVNTQFVFINDHINDTDFEFVYVAFCLKMPSNQMQIVLKTIICYHLITIL